MEAGRNILRRLRVSVHGGPSEDRSPLPINNPPGEGEASQSSDDNNAVSDIAFDVGESQSPSEFDWYPSAWVFWMGALQLVLGCVVSVTQAVEITLENSQRTMYVGAWAGMPIMMCAGVNMGVAAYKTKGAIRLIVVSCVIAFVFAALILWYSQPFVPQGPGMKTQQVTCWIMYVGGAMSMLPSLITGVLSVLILFTPGNMPPKCCWGIMEVPEPRDDTEQDVFSVTADNHCLTPPAYSVHSLEDNNPPAYTESQESLHVSLGEGGGAAPCDNLEICDNTDSTPDTETEDSLPQESPPAYQQGNWVPMRTQIFNTQISCQVGTFSESDS